MSDHVAIRYINDVRVYICTIFPNFWLINGVFVYGGEGYQLTDSDILSFIGGREEPMSFSSGAENDAVICIEKDPSSGGLMENTYSLHDFKNDVFLEKGQEAYREYKAWARI